MKHNSVQAVHGKVTHRKNCTVLVICPLLELYLHFMSMPFRTILLHVFQCISLNWVDILYSSCTKMSIFEIVSIGQSDIFCVSSWWSVWYALYPCIGIFPDMKHLYNLKCKNEYMYCQCTQNFLLVHYGNFEHITPPPLFCDK